MTVEVEQAEQIVEEMQDSLENKKKADLKFDHSNYEEEPFGQEKNGLTKTKHSSDTIPFKRDIPKVGRNEPCPCGSGKKYKHCCGRLT